METANSVIAVVAQEPANGSCGCAVIYGKPLPISSRGAGAADGAAPILLGEHPVVGSVWHAEPGLESDIGFLLRVSAAPFAIVASVPREIGASSRGDRLVRAQLTDRLMPVSGLGMKVELINRLHRLTAIARLLGWRRVGRRLRVLRSPRAMPVGLGAYLAPARKSVAVASIGVELRSRLRLGAAWAGFRFHSRSPLLPIGPAGMV